MQILRRALLTLTLVVSVIVLIVAALYAEENWRGARAWTAAQDELHAKGESLNRSHFVPPPVPASQNLAFSPFYVRALQYRPDPKTGVYTFGPEDSRPSDLRDLPFGASRPTSFPAFVHDLTRRTDFASYAR